MVINILPVNDTGDHIESEMCDCSPNIEYINGNWLITHNSYDKRELREAPIFNRPNTAFPGWM